MYGPRPMPMMPRARRGALREPAAPARTSRELVQIRPVLGRRDLRAFIRLPWRLYRDTPVGRITAHVDHRFNEFQGNDWGLFGFFEWVAANTILELERGRIVRERAVQAGDPK